MKKEKAGKGGSAASEGKVPGWEAIFRVLRQIPYSVQVYDTKGNVLMSNRAFLDVYGIGSEKDIPCKANILKHRFTKRLGMADGFRKALKGRIVTLPEVKISAREMGDMFKAKLKEDQYRQITLFPVIFSKKTVIVGIGIDMTKKTRLLGTLRESEEKFRSIVEQSTDGIVLIDGKGSVLEFNPSQERISGLKREGALGRKVWDVQAALFPKNLRTPEARRRHKALFRDFLKTGKAEWFNKSLDVEIERPDGARAFIQSVVFPIKLSASTLYVSISRDMTEIRKAQEALRNREKVLEEQNVLMQEKNAALREVLNHLEEEKRKIGRQVRMNVDRLVTPVVDRLIKTCSRDEKRYLEMVRENLNDITSSFGGRISQGMYRLSQREIEMCDMIKQGLPSREIARLRNISFRTVDTHRTRIRRKLGIRDKKINLAVYLRDL